MAILQTCFLLMANIKISRGKPGANGTEQVNSDKSDFTLPGNLGRRSGS
ncbi:hypothetical protein Zm00014a_008007 [Zea mays]|uniref:Uncharacterized protein n=1 Tax=Zea mays TaxID=4577 RepID=A0A3L6E899_MAIZE|nr:hypothetical protein Zm00014a_008007 [Zea mays]